VKSYLPRSLSYSYLSPLTDPEIEKGPMSRDEDVRFLQEFREKVDQYLFLGFAPVTRPDAHEFDAESFRRLQRAQEDRRIRELRKEINEMKLRVKHLLAELDLTPTALDFPAPAVGGPVLSYDMIELITDNDSEFRLEKDRVLGILDQAIGALKSGTMRRVQQPRGAGKQIFVVHGHDEGAKESTSRFIEKLGLGALILHEQPNRGRTIIEKFEDYSNVGFAVVLLTPDDMGVAKELADRPDKWKPRARQDVIFELGFFSGKLGRSKVCVLYKEGVDIPSDYLGVVYVPIDSGGAWRLKLAREMKSAGIDIDLNKAL
jgi:predicted nucleotide-binding protein